MIAEPPAELRPWWDRFRAHAGAGVDARFYEAFHFDDNAASADELATLVLAGPKRATAGLVWSFEAAGRPWPQPGALSVVTRWDGTPACVIETRAVEVKPFDEVDAAFAAAEGEGDGSLRHWREVHWLYFGRECRRLGREPGLRMPVVCERFEVVWRG